MRVVCGCVFVCVYVRVVCVIAWLCMGVCACVFVCFIVCVWFGVCLCVCCWFGSLFNLFALLFVLLICVCARVIVYGCVGWCECIGCVFVAVFGCVLICVFIYMFVCLHG